MKGRLMLASGRPADAFSVYEVVKIAQDKARRDSATLTLSNTISNIVKKAEGETGAALRSTVGSTNGPTLGLEEALRVAGTKVNNYGTSPKQPSRLAPPTKGRGSWSPVVADRASLGLHEDREKLSSILSNLFNNRLEGLSEVEKQAFLRPLLSLGKGIAGRLAAKKGVTGRVGKFLQRDVRSPVQLSKSGPRTATVGVRSPLASSGAKPPPIPKDALSGGAGGPYRAPAKPIRAGKPAAEKPLVKPKSLTRQLLPGALMLGAGYGLYKGVPSTLNWLNQASNAPMSYNFGNQQYQYGYSPSGQAMF